MLIYTLPPAIFVKMVQSCQKWER